MSRRRKKYVPRKWESKEFAFLSDHQKMLYVCCKAQYYGKRKLGRDYPDVG